MPDFACGLFSVGAGRPRGSWCVIRTPAPEGAGEPGGDIVFDQVPDPREVEGHALRAPSHSCVELEEAVPDVASFRVELELVVLRDLSVDVGCRGSASGVETGAHGGEGRV